MPICIYLYLYLYIYIYMSIYPSLSLCLSISIYIYLYLSISIYIYLYLSISIYIYLYLSISIYIYLAYIYLYLPIYIYIYLYLSVSIYIYQYLSISIYICLSICPSIYSRLKHLKVIPIQESQVLHDLYGSTIPTNVKQIRCFTAETIRWAACHVLISWDAQKQKSPLMSSPALNLWNLFIVVPMHRGIIVCLDLFVISTPWIISQSGSSSKIWRFPKNGGIYP